MQEPDAMLQALNLGHLVRVLEQGCKPIIVSRLLLHPTAILIPHAGSLIQFDMVGPLGASWQLSTKALFQCSRLPPLNPRRASRGLRMRLSCVLQAIVCSRVRS